MPSRLCAVLSLVALACAATAYSAPIPLMNLATETESAELPRWISFSGALVPDTDVILHWTGVADGDAWTLRAVPTYDDGEDVEAVVVVHVPSDQAQLKWHFPAATASRNPTAYRFCITDASADLAETWGDCTGQVPVSQGSVEVEEDMTTVPLNTDSPEQVVLLS